VGGTGVAAVIGFILLPVLTRIYTPEEFSNLAVFNAVVAMGSVAACLRFEFAIPLPEQSEEAVNVLALSLISAFCVSAAIAIPVVLFSKSLFASLKHPQLAAYAWLVPLNIFGVAAYSSLQYWAVRKKDFAGISFSRMLQAFAAAATQVCIGSVGGTTIGLILGPVASATTGAMTLLRRFLQRDRAALQLLTFRQIGYVFTTYQRFPKYSVIEALSNSAGMQLPVIMIAALASGPEAGFLLLALSISQAPMGLLGNAIGQWYLSHGPAEHRSNSLGQFTAKVMRKLIAAGVGPLCLAGIIAPRVFGLFFGAQWYRAGELMSWMTPWFVMQFLANPLSMSLPITGHQKTGLALQLFGLVLRTLAVYAAGCTAPKYISETFAVSGFLFYSVYLAVILFTCGAKGGEIIDEARSAARIVAIWIVSGVGIISVLP
jgi:O-antigen/teichoic acid export membrane protein